MEELKKDVESIKDTLQGQQVELARYNTLLEVHIKRTELIEERIEPIETHVKFLRGLSKLVLTVLAGAASIATILRLFWIG